MWLIDTNVISELARREPAPGVLRWAESVESVVLSVVTVEEIHYGLAWRPNPRILAWFGNFMSDSTVLPVTNEIARRAGELRGELASRGVVRTQADMLNDTRQMEDYGIPSRFHSPPKGKTMHALEAIVSAALLTATAAQGATAMPESPHYRDGVLTLPAVNTDAQVGKYQDVTFELTSAGTWRLNGVFTLGEGDAMMYRAPVTRVDVVKSGSSPTQVLLRVQGEFNSGCGSLGRVTQRRVGTAFQVLLADGFKAYAVATCAAVMMPYVKTIPLDVYGLAVGVYTYEVNGVTGSFELSAENVYPGDCFGSTACR